MSKRAGVKLISIYSYLLPILTAVIPSLVLADNGLQINHNTFFSQLPPPEELLEQPSKDSLDENNQQNDTIRVNGFKFVGNTAFTEEELLTVVQDFIGKELTFGQLLEARSAITQKYIDAGYVTSGAFIPPQELEQGIVTINIVEGRLEDIVVKGKGRLNDGYVRERIAVAADTPLNVNKILEALQLLQLDPLIENISAELSAGANPGESYLEVLFQSAESFDFNIVLDNGRSPSVGTFRRKAEIIEGNLFGYGDEVYFAYTNTDGSDVLDAAYTIPVNAYNGTVRFFYSNRDSDVIEPPFDRIDIESESELYEITYRQPIIRTPEQEFTLGITGSHRQGQTYILDDIPFSLSLGADEGETRISSLRFFQEWVQRSQTDVFALRSQFSFGVDLLGTTQNDDLPDGDYFAWRGQAQWVKLLDTETLLLARTDIQLAGTDLLAQEQFGLGGIESVRGYRQDALLTDSGVLASVELRLPLYHEPQDDIVLQIVPFVDFGMGWNLSKREDPDPDHLFSVGLGLQFEYSDYLSMRFDWGIPLVDIDSRDRTWQEQGLYFSVIYNLF